MFEAPDNQYSTDFFSQFADLAQQQQSQPDEQEQPGIPEENDQQSQQYSDDDFTALQDRYDQLNERINTIESGRTPYEGDDEFLNFLFSDNSNDPIDISYKPQLKSTDLLSGIAKGESGGNYYAQNPQPGQTAYGKYQFTNAAQKDAYNTTGGSKTYGSFENYQKAFKSNPQVQEEAMNARMNQARKVVGDDPAALALYHYAPKFGKMYAEGKLDLSKSPSDYGIGKGVKNPSFQQFLKTHGFQNGGYVDDVSMQGYNVDSPYNHNPFLDIHTPTGEITMERTLIPLLGEDENGVKKIMHPGQKYKFSGNQVRETPLFQNGGDINEVKNFYNNYLNSPNYKKRLLSQGYSNPKNVIDHRLNNLNNTTVGITKNGTEYNQKKK
jgi:hypothetical protein